MRAPLNGLSCLLLLLIAPAVSAVTMEWTFIGDSGNAGDPQTSCVHCTTTTTFGAVDYAYWIGTYEVTNAQYTEFLNAKAASDPRGLYNTAMTSQFGGITRNGSSGSYSYSLIAGREDWPVVFVSSYDALRFANWLNNGQGDADTENGTYTLFNQTGGAFRNAGAIIALPNENEWYKAAYYDSVAQSYFDYPGGSDGVMICATPTAAANQANCDDSVANLTPAGSYSGSSSPYGTFDQGGNALEWNEAFDGQGGRGIRGGAYFQIAEALAASNRGFIDRYHESSVIGFRVAMIPEPGTGLLTILGLLGLAGWRRTRFGSI